MSGKFLFFLLSWIGSLALSSTPVNFDKWSGGATHNNWAILVCTSSYWFNYRHFANILGIYKIIRSMGIPDSQIILFDSMRSVCDPRNQYPGAIFTYGREQNLYEKSLNSTYTAWLREQLGVLKPLSELQIPHAHEIDSKCNFDGQTIEVDYRGEEVTVDSFLRLLTGRQYRSTPKSQRLLSNNESKILMFLSGHGGDEFFKFRDAEEMSSQDLAEAVKIMELKERYGEMLIMVDTCQAATLFNAITSPRITFLSSSVKGENSYARETDAHMGVALLDRFSDTMAAFFRNVDNNGNLIQAAARLSRRAKTSKISPGLATLQDLAVALDPRYLYSHASLVSGVETRTPTEIPLRDFFGTRFQVKMFTALSKPIATSTSTSWACDAHSSLQNVDRRVDGGMPSRNLDSCTVGDQSLNMTSCSARSPGIVSSAKEGEDDGLQSLRQCFCGFDFDDRAPQAVQELSDGQPSPQHNSNIEDHIKAQGLQKELGATMISDTFRNNESHCCHTKVGEDDDRYLLLEDFEAQSNSMEILFANNEQIEDVMPERSWRVSLGRLLCMFVLLYFLSYCWPLEVL